MSRRWGSTCSTLSSPALRPGSRANDAVSGGRTAGAGALADPARAANTRRLLHQHFNPYAGMSFKELLAAAPLDLELDFDRTVDAGREIEF